MRKLILALALVGTGTAFAAPTQVIEVQDDLIKKVKITEIEDDQDDLNASMNPSWESDCTKLDRRKVETNQNPDLDDIVNIGRRIWEVVKNNAPVLEARTMAAHALPRGVQCWDELATWSAPRSKSYQIVYENLYGTDVVTFKFRTMYTAGGSFKGQGRYITNATIQYSNVEVLWGYIFNANVEIPQVVNMGTEASPIGGMQMTLNWNVSTHPVSLKKSISSVSFFVAGDGRPMQVLD